MLLLAGIVCTKLAPSPTPSPSYGPGPCDKLSGASWCDRNLGFLERSKLLVANLTVAEKSGLFTNGMAPVSRVGLPAYGWWSEALHGVARDGIATSFPQVIGLGSTMNKSLWYSIGNATGVEGRGKNNKRSYNNKNFVGLDFWAPNVNIFRDPRWGRGQETPGEDPTITAREPAPGPSGAPSA